MEGGMRNEEGSKNRLKRVSYKVHLKSAMLNVCVPLEEGLQAGD